ncbi:hypothetical protein MUK71_13520 [Arthrobacter zhangbolii]|uniref:Uncharacterized protein n=1 Tax=Arthrobacter zhangbolii TaxID=2886936 RepID=A0A9X1M7Z9_9MICC|nr:hypothetical protein [Arthrobacter zhangbolii]MCC3272555.1 hypothetical protein [Arthrobacter zhangbolii]MCC3293961.1 hypothetical protein [Arthrobacter zhangbolii]UON91594.1 hypothetical protein MUK71_13520 [Arthrobacter zhangbolii]
MRHRRRWLWAVVAVASVALAAYGVVWVSDVLSPETACGWVVRAGDC